MTICTVHSDLLFITLYSCKVLRYANFLLATYQRDSELLLVIHDSRAYDILKDFLKDQVSVTSH